MNVESTKTNAICVNVVNIKEHGSKRLGELKEVFAKRFGANPEFYVKVPGRYK